MYTFTEQCKEIPGLPLDDGTQKIFLNMNSKHGRPELVSLLQYMKDTRIDNPDIIVKDRRILELDEIVTEIKQDEEWEDTKMSIYGLGLEQGEKQGELNKTKIVIRNLLKREMSDEDICALAECTQELIDEVRNTIK
ncbi:MAG: hypothetical protein IJN54_05335 [Lachnospiraceae bacterium]|nr:hypothetical protein [Lachnospiraceae bacterium]